MSTDSPPSTPADVALLGGGRQLIARQLRRAPREFTVGGVGTILYAAATVLLSFVIGWITDSVLLPAVEAGEVATTSLVGAATAVLGVAAVRGVGITLRRAGAYFAQYRLQYRDRIEVTNRYLELPIEWHRSHPTGQLLANVNEDVEAASFIAAPLPMAFGVVVMLAITGALLVLTDPFLALIGFAVGPALMAANYTFQRRMRAVAATAQRLRAEVAEIAHESFDAALVVKTLGREDAEVGRFGQTSDELRDRMVEVGRLRAAFDPVIEALPNIGILAILAVGAWRVDQGAVSAGTLITFAYLFRLVALPMRVFGWLLGELPRSVVGMDRVENVLQEDETVVYGGQVPTPAGGAAADAESVGYLHPESDFADLTSAASEAQPEADGDERRGVESITLSVAPGATVALVGPTGSGKSTFAHLLVRLFDPDRGEITLDGHGLLELDRDTLAASVSIVFQETFLFNDTIYNNIALGDAFDESEVLAASRLAQAHDFITEFPAGYGTVVGERGASLSGGQRQRIALARALVRRPRLLVLDDATSAVDPAVESAILEGLRSLDTTVVVVAYRRSSIVLADEVIYIDYGRVIDRGTHAELYASLPAYRDLIDAYDQQDAPS
ncbi:MAG TPA: ABC transporter ATP-binding protein [Acidimicrobiia bacterium]|jgi:ABC-type multidrug transport system fused ATPase/permease subunit|nr:ABC transporter ATP-binding protein [Acidimicrobiia bacterium]